MFTYKPSILHTLFNIFNNENTSQGLKLQCLICVEHLCNYEITKGHSQLIVNNLLDIINNTDKDKNNEIIQEVIKIFIDIILLLREEYYIYIYTVNRIFYSKDISDPTYSKYVKMLLNDEKLPEKYLYKDNFVNQMKVIQYLENDEMYRDTGDVNIEDLRQSWIFPVRASNV